MEKLIGSRSNDSLRGNTFANEIGGGAGNGTLLGGGGNDTLKGNAGNDMLLGGVAADKLQGGFGVDSASYARPPRRTPAPFWESGPIFPTGGRHGPPKYPNANTGEAKRPSGNSGRGRWPGRGVIPDGCRSQSGQPHVDPGHPSAA